MISPPQTGRAVYRRGNDSYQCMGSLLKQSQDGKEVTIRCASRVMNQHERNYTTLENKTLEIIFGLKFLKLYLHNAFTIRTDHKPLLWLHGVKNPQGRIARWLMFLS